MSCLKDLSEVRLTFVRLPRLDADLVLRFASNRITRKLQWKAGGERLELESFSSRYGRFLQATCLCQRGGGLDSRKSWTEGYVLDGSGSGWSTPQGRSLEAVSSTLKVGPCQRLALQQSGGITGCVPYVSEFQGVYFHGATGKLCLENPNVCL